MRGKLWLGFLVIIVLLWVICIYAVLSSMSVREVFIELGHYVVPSAITAIEMRTELNEVREETLAYILRGDVVSEGKTSREQLEELYGELKEFAGEHLEHEVVVGSKAREDAEKLAILSQKLILASAEITRLKDQGAGVDELLEKMDQDVQPAFVALRGLVGELIAEHQKQLSAVETLVHEKHDTSIRIILIVGISTTLIALVVASFVDRFFVKYITKRKRVQEVLREREVRYRTLVENIPQKIFLKDRNSTYISCNENYARDLKIKSHEIAEKNDYEFYSKQLAEKYRRDDKRIMESGRTEDLEEQYIRDGEKRWVHTLKTPVKNEDGNITGILGIFRDITERKKAEEGLKKRTYDLGERVKELNCLYGISELVESKGISLEEILQGTADLIPLSWQYPEITCARIILEDQTFRTKNFKETAWKQTSDIRLRGGYVGTLEVYYLEERPESDEGPFFKEERHLINTIAERLGRIIDRWNTEKELRIKEEAIASSINAITIADIKGNLTYVNRSFLNLWGYDEDKEVLGKPVTELLQEGEKALEVMEVLRKKKNWIGELVARRKDGSTFDVQLLASTVKDEVGEAICFMASLVDITERKKIEQMKDDFISLASHELRTPLTSIVGYVDLILDGDTGKINKEQREFLEIISQNTRRLEALINDVLDIEKIESVRIKMKRERVNLNEIVEACIDTFRVVAEGKGLKLEKEIKADRIEVWGDSDRLSQVLSNLLSNAIKYTKKGKVKVTVQTKGKFASVAIEDTGVGMSQDELSSVFARFFRSNDSYVRKTTGSGLGLSIAKATMERHNGDIKVESELGVGSRLEVILPLLKEQKKGD